MQMPSATLWLLASLMLLTACASAPTGCPPPESQAPMSAPPSNLMAEPADLMPLLNELIQVSKPESKPSAPK